MNPTARHCFAAVVVAGLVTFSLGAAKNESGDRNADLRAASADPALIRQGRESYAALCQTCHGEEKAKDSLGDAPSNLFDDKWYNGSQPAQIEGNILNGILEKGMPPWKEVLPAEDTTALAAFLLSFQKRNAAPQASAQTSSPAK